MAAVQFADHAPQHPQYGRVSSKLHPVATTSFGAAQLDADTLELGPGHQVHAATGTTHLLNEVAVPDRTRQQGLALAELMTVLDRRTGYLQGSKGGFVLNPKEDGPLSYSRSDGTVVVLSQTVPPQFAATHSLRRSASNIGIPTQFDRPYSYLAVPHAATAPPMHSNTPLAHLTSFLNRMGEHGGFIEINNRPALQVMVYTPDQVLTTFTVDPNVKHGDGPLDFSARVVNFTQGQIKARSGQPSADAAEAAKPPELFTDPNDSIDPNDPTPPVDIDMHELSPAQQSQVVQTLLAELVEEAPQAMFEGSKVPSSSVTLIDGPNGPEYRYDLGQLQSHANAYRLGWYGE
ncbi:MAG: hypothetical protein KC475_08750 [Cyanobacteria bacterium HKST-UBA03]|nr:hypothetical protein [Cyanobacteria bacterium HKST-UBA03]